jgi:hypothetical protein
VTLPVLRSRPSIPPPHLHLYSILPRFCTRSANPRHEILSSRVLQQRSWILSLSFWPPWTAECKICNCSGNVFLDCWMPDDLFNRFRRICRSSGYKADALFDRVLTTRCKCCRLRKVLVFFPFMHSKLSNPTLEPLVKIFRAMSVRGVPPRMPHVRYIPVS